MSERRTTLDLPEVCRDITERLVAYRARILPPDQTLRVEAHVAFCPGCQRRWEELERSGPTPSPPEPPARVSGVERPPVVERPSVADRPAVVEGPPPVVERAPVVVEQRLPVVEPRPPRGIPPLPVDEQPPVAAEPPPVVQRRPVVERTPVVTQAAVAEKPGVPAKARISRGAKVGLVALIAGLVALIAGLLRLAQERNKESSAPRPASERAADTGAGAAAADGAGAAAGVAAPSPLGVAALTDTGTPIDPEALALAERVTAAASARDYHALERLLPGRSADRDLAALREAGTLDQLVRVFQVRPGITDGYSQGYHYPGFVFRPGLVPDQHQSAEMGLVGATADGPPACNGYRGITTGIELRTTGGPRRFVWTGVERRC